MKVPEEMKLDTNLAVVFKKPFEFNGVKCNAIIILERTRISSLRRLSKL